jgi:hypothetical protein
LVQPAASQPASQQPVSSNFTNFLKYKLTHLQTYKLSNFETLKLSDFQTYKLSHTCIINFQTANLANFPREHLQTSELQTFKVWGTLILRQSWNWVSPHILRKDSANDMRVRRDSSQTAWILLCQFHWNLVSIYRRPASHWRVSVLCRQYPLWLLYDVNHKLIWLNLWNTLDVLDIT